MLNMVKPRYRRGSLFKKKKERRDKLGLQIGSNYWMAWASPVSADEKPVVDSTTLIVVYVVLAIGSSFSVLARAILLVTADKMHECIFRAPMSFFDATPSGRILNRVSDYVFKHGAWLLQTKPKCRGSEHFTSNFSLCFLYDPAFWELLQSCYMAETISGLTTIRSFDQESRFWDTNIKLIDGYSRPKFSIAGAMRWLCFRLDILSTITFAFSLVFLISVPEGVIDPGIAGLAVTYGLNLNILQAWVILDRCQMENKIISVERILQYSSIPSEPPLVIESNRPDPSWPSSGEVDIRNLQALDKCQLGDEVRKKQGKLDSAGLIEEFDSPAILLENKSSSFAQLVTEYTMRSNSEF
ncbi:ABC transporter type 1, transmembrane domain containing protein [Parasponia andersonii]|uniref:ABC transporter type 1, transmembrane domain containing protein n=1 Tax=Parasponia andersonii TaxID=3476 RepID=A0A2P5B3U9_PARAD|nr:ABC transporter type 1, transmembrane domain containing protein [Parasponia andersonii]